jgi:hypothetical protein
MPSDSARLDDREVERDLGRVVGRAQQHPPARDEAEPVVNLDRLGYPEHLNATVELVDRHVAEGRGERVALVSTSSTVAFRCSG